MNGVSPEQAAWELIMGRWVKLRMLLGWLEFLRITRKEASPDRADAEYFLLDIVPGCLVRMLNLLWKMEWGFFFCLFFFCQIQASSYLPYSHQCHFVSWIMHLSFTNSVLVRGRITNRLFGSNEFLCLKKRGIGRERKWVDRWSWCLGIGFGLIGRGRSLGYEETGLGRKKNTTLTPIFQGWFQLPHVFQISPDFCWDKDVHSTS